MPAGVLSPSVHPTLASAPTLSSSLASSSHPLFSKRSQSYHPCLVPWSFLVHKTQHTHIAISFEGYALFIQSSDFYSFCYPPLPSHCPTPTPPTTHTFILLGPQVGGQSGAEKFFIGWSWCRWFHALLLGLVFLICGIRNMTQMNLSMKQKQIHRHREHTCGCQGGWLEGRLWLGLAHVSYYT